MKSLIRFIVMGITVTGLSACGYPPAEQSGYGTPGYEAFYITH